MEQTKIHAGLYLRLSREDEGDEKESNSITNQRIITTDFAESHGMEIVDEYVDDGYSGATFERPSWKRLIEDCKTGRVDCIIVKDASRMGRNSVEFGRYLDRIFPSWGIRLICIGDMFDNAKDDDSTSSMTMAFKGLMNDMYCRDMSNKEKAALHYKMKRGLFIGAIAPYGYLRDPEKKGHLIVDEDEADVVRTIFRLKMDGVNCKNIAQYLNERGVPPPAKCLRMSETGTWSNASINNILTNEVYIGTMVQGKTKKPSYKSKKIVRVPREDWIRVEGTHEAIIGWNEFQFVQELMGMDTTTPNGKTHLNLLTGFLRCGDCGQNLNKYTSKGNTYYRCSEFVRREGNCTAHCCSAAKMERALTLALRRQAELLDRVLVEIEENQVMPKRKKQQAAINAEIADKLKVINENRQKQTHAFRDQTVSVMTSEDYVSWERTWQDRVDGAEKDIKDLQERSKKVEDEIAYLIPWLERVRSFGKITKLNRTILSTMIHYVDVFEDGRMEIKFRYMDDIAEILEGIDLNAPVKKKIITTQKLVPARVRTMVLEGYA